MTQHRYFDNGTDATAALFKEMLSGLTGKGILSGGDLGVSGTDRLLVSPVWVALDSPRTTVHGLTRNAVLLNEDTTKELLVTTSSAPANYTIVYQHDDMDIIGGVEASLVLLSGLRANENIDNGVVLGWILYPGGAVSLAESHLIPAPQMRIEAISTVGDGQFWTAPFTGFMSAHLDGPPLVSVTNGYEHAYAKAGLLLDNSTNALPSREMLRWTFVVGPQMPGTITFDYVVTTGQIITIDIQDTLNRASSTTMPGSTLLSGMLTSDFSQDALLESYSTGLGTLEVRRRRLRITNGTFQSGKRFRVQATVQTPAGATTLVTGVGHSPYRKPFSL